MSYAAKVTGSSAKDMSYAAKVISSSEKDMTKERRLWRSFFVRLASDDRANARHFERRDDDLPMIVFLARHIVSNLQKFEI